MSTKPNKKNQESESLQEQIIKLEKQLESFKHSNEHFLKNKLFLHYDIKEPEKVVVDCETKLPVIAEYEKKKIQKGKESDPTHLIIEGDNYHALSVLNYTHAGKVDLIYIDPPYNTGNRDWKYNNDYVDAEDSFRHSKWLSFMSSRLRLAKNLMRDDGFIVCAIDHYELFYLGILMDTVFGEENRLGIVAVVHKAEGRNQEKFFGTSHEYMLFYAKNKTLSKFNKTVLDADIQATFNLKDAEGSYRLNNYLRSGGGDQNLRVNKPHFFYPIYVSKDLKHITLESKSGYEKILPITNSGQERTWKTVKETFLDRLDAAQIVADRDQNNKIQIYEKYRENQVIKTHWVDPKYHAIHYGTKLIEKILGEKKFDFPKSLYLLIDTLKLTTKKDSIVLDFFAGSGTTGHAVLKLNAQDGGTRQFILCTNNENKIAEDVTYPRIKKVIDGYGDNAPIPSNFRYFQTDFVEKKGSVSQLKIDLTRKCAEMLCVKENVFEAVKIKKTTKNYKLFKNGDKYLGVFFDFFTDPEFTDFIKELNALPKEAEKAVYVFVLDGSAGILADEFAGVANCEVKEIPQKILDIYKQLAREASRK
ncbi:MAG: site-specific DNA-methyltransferase [Minisyncoccia bacterium]